MAAYGLYSHIQSNKRRSIALLISLFLLVYILVYAGALAAEALSYNASVNWYLQRAWRDFLQAAPWATIGTIVWVVIAYYFHQSMIDAVTYRRPRRHANRGTAPLQSPGKPVHLARHHDAETQDHRGRRAECFRDRHE